MTKYIDKTGRVSGIEIKMWNGSGYGPCIEEDFFDDRKGYNEEKNAYIVDDIDYMMEQAVEMKHNLPEPDDCYIERIDYYPDN